MMVTRASGSDLDRRIGQTPFLDSYTREPAPVSPSALQRRGHSPFLSEYTETETEDEAPTDPIAEQYFEIVSELADEEMDDAIHELVDEASALVGRYGGPEVSSEQQERLERMLREHFSPLATAGEELIAQAEQRAGALDLATASESEVDEALDRVPPTAALSSPAFEQFLGALKKKLKKVAKKAVGLVKKGIALSTGPLLKLALAKLKPLVRPLLEKVIKIALDKIPEQYRPLIVSVAKKLGLKPLNAVLSRVAPSADQEPVTTPSTPQEPAASDEPATADASEVQSELDGRIAEMLLARDPMELEAATTVAETPDRDPMLDLDRARGRFARELLDAETDGEAGPVVENFLPAILLAVRTGIKLIGRPKVVAFLGGLIGNFLKPFVGKASAPLGRLVADLGLKTFLQAETSAEDGRRVAAEMLANTVEETVQRVAALPEEVLDQPELYEPSAHEAFEAAAAATLPASLIKPELRESEGGAWVTLPLGARKQYRKFNRVVDVQINPQMAGAITTYGGETLAGFLRDRLRVRPGATVGARVHLYQAAPRTRLSKISAGERVRGLGTPRADGWSQLHPLTRHAAGMLLGAPKLGRAFHPHADRRRPKVGERYYYLEIPEAPAQPMGHESHLHFTIDFVRQEIRACMYLSEVVAQQVATSLRKDREARSAIAALRSVFAIPTEPGAGPVRRIRIIDATALPDPGRTLAAALGREARQALRRRLSATILDWTWVRLAETFANGAAGFIAKAEEPADGVRLAITFQAPPELGALRRVFRGRPAQASEWPPKQVPSGTVVVSAGPKHDG